MNREDLEALHHALDREALKDARDERKQMNEYERFALNEHLSGYPTDLSYDEVMQLVLDRSDEVLVWEVFEHFNHVELWELIDNMRNNLYLTFIPRTGEGK